MIIHVSFCTTCGKCGMWVIKQLSKFDKKQKFQGDKGDKGAERTTIPKKKPRKQELPAEIKEDNKKKAQKRIFVAKINRPAATVLLSISETLALVSI